MINNNAWNFDNTYTVGDILYADTTSTLAKQNIGTAGQVLTVSGGLPTWQTPGTVSPVVPPTTYFFETDFFADVPLNNTVTNNNWRYGEITTETNHPGQIFSLVLSNLLTGTLRFLMTSPINISLVDQIDIYFLSKLNRLSTGSPRYKSYKGLTSSNLPVSSSYGIYFTYTDTEFGGNFAINTKNGIPTTSLDSGVPGDLNWHLFQIQITGAGTSAEFFIDNVSVGTINTNINTNADHFIEFSDIVSVAGPFGALTQVDYYAHQLTMVGTRF